MSTGSQGVTHTRNYNVAANTVIVPGEFLIYDPSTPGTVVSARTFSAAIWPGEVGARTLFKALFAGISLGASIAGDTKPIPVAVAGRYTMPVIGSAVTEGDRVGFVKEAAANAIARNSVGVSVNPLTTIGRVVRSEQIPSGSATFEFDATVDDLGAYTNTVTFSATDTPSGTKNLVLGRTFAGAGLIRVVGASVTTTAVAHADESLTVIPQLIPFTGAGAGTALALSDPMVLNTSAGRILTETDFNPANAIRVVDAGTTFDVNMNHVYVAGGSATPIAGLRFTVTFIAAPNYL